MNDLIGTVEFVRLQPLLHDAAVCVRAPAVVLSAADGSLQGTGVHGVLVADRRALHTLRPEIEGCRLEFVGAPSARAGSARFVSVVRPLGDDGPDPTVTLEHDRTVRPDGSVERFTLVSRAADSVRCTLSVVVAGDLLGVDAIKAGEPAGALPAVAAPDGLRFVGAAHGSVRVTVTGTPVLTPGEAVSSVAWELDVQPGDATSVELTIAVVGDPDEPAVVAAETVPWSVPRVEAGDHRLPALLDRSLDDLAGLLLRDPDLPQGQFLAAGAPWFLTLFGRDSILAASLLLPLGTELALGTLHALAARQGKQHDETTEEQPGKIPHELRRAGSSLPPLYYGTVDATPLWISLLHDAWRWGLPDHEVAPLLDHLEAALRWLATDGLGLSGFVEYTDHSGGQLLSNQGWKDSGDSIRFADGRLAEAPVALCEVQAYSYRAARQGADLLEHFGRPGGERWRGWAAQLRQRFHAAFWVERDGRRYPALALDRHGTPVDAVTSNLGHLLGSGLLDPDDSTAVAGLLAGPGLDSGFGLRTLDASSAGFNPLGYHTGSVWPHDTAVAVLGLAADGHDAAARSLAGGLLRAAPAFDFRLPELFGGGTGERPLAYPAACRPQAWSAAASVGVLGVLAGLSPDVPGRQVSLRPLGRSLTVAGLRVAGTPVTVRVDADGQGEIDGLPAGMRIRR